MNRRNKKPLIGLSGNWDELYSMSLLKGAIGISGVFEHSLYRSRFIVRMHFKFCELSRNWNKVYCSNWT